MPDECCLYDVITISKIMQPGYANAVCCRRMKPRKPMECADKRSWNGDGRVCFPSIGPMIVGWWFSRRPMSTLLRRILANIKKHPHRTEGVQYATTSFVCGVYGLQTRAATAIETMKSANRGFQRGLFSTISSSTLFMRSVSATFVRPPKYSNASIKQRMRVGVSQRFTNVTKRMREYPRIATIMYNQKSSPFRTFSPNLFQRDNFHAALLCCL